MMSSIPEKTDCWTAYDAFGYFPGLRSEICRTSGIKHGVEVSAVMLQTD